MNKISIKWKIYLFLLGFCALLLLILWLFQVIFLDSFYKKIKISEVKSAAATIVRQIDDDNLQEVVEAFAENNDLCIEVLSESGTQLYSAHASRNCMIHSMPVHEKINLVVKTLESGGELLEYLNPDSNRLPRPSAPLTTGSVDTTSDTFRRIPPIDRNPNQSIIYSKIITDEHGKIVVVLINSMIIPVNATTQTLRVQLSYITILMVLFSIFMAFFIAKRVSTPIEKLNESAKTLAKGNYETIFSGTGYREINELSDTLNQTAKELSQVEKLRQDLIANISHDLRTPLTLISGYAEAMRDLPGEMKSENAQIILDETNRLSTMVNDLLDISKLQSGMHQVSPAIYDLTEQLQKTIHRLNELLKNDGYEISFNHDHHVLINADESKIAQAFYNLLINAVNYTGDDKKVVVTQRITDDSVTIEVMNTGAGIEAEMLPYIWDRYFKIDENHRRGVTGTGLGLSIVKSIVELHQGQYGVISHPDENTIFWFSLPHHFINV
ncbi:sensor histidine kinase [Anoxynatronum buryatiense]|uniref:histidine kinase n=1 Tax=Anoxynatronum buryatiense TaxID=489973 RepID=A0AA46AID9_9CLOT|nr:HAMP domain-containing sensor histidine kinase [Anoxynatronum buryatiense]SMP48198.1 Signal transduction histidine kinase [Anoxynatronum buryatiense]